MKNWFMVFFCCLLLNATGASAQTPSILPENSLNNLITGSLASGQTPPISAATLRQVLLDMVHTTFNLDTIPGTLETTLLALSPSANIASTGLPGFNTQIYVAISEPTAEPTNQAALRVDRTDSYVGGDATTVNNAIWALHTVGTGVQTFEWTIYGQLLNSATTQGQNVAIGGYATAMVAGASPTFGGGFTVQDNIAAGNPTNGRTSLELDQLANGPDDNNNRILLNMVGGTVNRVGTTPTISTAWKVGGQDDTAASARFVNGGLYCCATFTTLLNASADVTTTNGIDLHAATIGTNAIWIPTATRIALDTGALRYFAYNNGSLLYHGTGGFVFQVDDSGNAQVQGHLQASGFPSPALTVCGTSPAIAGDDKAGQVTMGTGAPTGCVITFVVAYNSAPYCTVTWLANPLATQSYVVSASAITLTQTATSSNTIAYHCMARLGG